MARSKNVISSNLPESKVSPGTVGTRRKASDNPPKKRKESTFREEIGKEFSELFIWGIKKLKKWLKLSIKELERLIGGTLSGKEYDVQIRLFRMFIFGVFIYYLGEYSPMEHTHRSILLKTGVGTVLIATVILLSNAAEPMLVKFGLLDPLIKLRDKILKKLGLF